MVLCCALKNWKVNKMENEKTMLTAVNIHRKNEQEVLC